MTKFTLPLLAICSIFASSVYARDTTEGAPYFDPANFDYKTLLGNPPAAGSPEEQQEIAVLLQKQATRTPDDVARIKVEAHPDIHFFLNVLGSWFVLDHLPATAKLLQNVDKEEHPIVDAAKKFWKRPRPPFQDERIHPAVEIPSNASYPSGHSTFGNLNAMVLAELAPDLKDKILARGQQIGEDRLLGGVHFPSDVKAGYTLAAALFAKLMADPAFQTDLAKAKAEVALARSHDAGPAPIGK
jgi:acid phosphatase (class A)